MPSDDFLSALDAAQTEAGGFTAVIMPMMVEGNKDPFPEDEAIAISLPEMAMA